MSVILTDGSSHTIVSTKLDKKIIIIHAGLWTCIESQAAHG